MRKASIFILALGILMLSACGESVTVDESQNSEVGQSVAAGAEGNGTEKAYISYTWQEICKPLFAVPFRALHLV